MGKRSKKLILLLVLVAVLAAVCVLLASLNKEDEAPAADDTTILLAEFDGNSVTEIVYTYNGSELAFTSVGGQWSYNGDPEFPLTQNTITTMIADIAAVNATRELTDAEDPSSYGFDDPTLILTVISEGAEHTFEIGDLNSYSGKYYLRYEDKIYMTDDVLVTTFSKNLYDYLTTTDLPALENIVSFTVDGNEITDETAVADLSESYDTLIRGNVADYRSRESYGFDGTEHTVVVNYTVDNAVTDTNGSTVSTVTTENSYTFMYAYVGENAYIMLQDDDLVYEVSGTSSFDVLDDNVS